MYRLGCPHLHDTPLVLHSEHAAEDDGILVKAGMMRRPFPSRGRMHQGDRDPRVSGIHQTEVLVAQLLPVAHGFHPFWRTDQSRHGSIVPA